MNINKETVEKIAHLARLSFDDASENKMKDDMNAILTFVDKLQELDTTEVKPLESMSFEVNNLREDIASPKIDPEKVLKLAPQAEPPYFLVPKVIE